MPVLIGSVSWRGPTVAELWGRNIWVCRTNGKPDPILEKNLAALYADRVVYGGPWDGFYGYAVLRDLATIMNGRFRWNPPVPTQGEVIY